MYAYARLFVVLVLLIPAGWAQPPAARALEKSLRERLSEPLKTLELGMIMLGEDFFGAAPSGVRWSHVRGTDVLVETLERTGTEDVAVRARRRRAASVARRSTAPTTRSL